MSKHTKAGRRASFRLHAAHAVGETGNAYVEMLLRGTPRLTDTEMDATINEQLARSRVLFPTSAEGMRGFARPVPPSPSPRTFVDPVGDGINRALRKHGYYW